MSFKDKCAWVLFIAWIILAVCNRWRWHNSWLESAGIKLILFGITAYSEYLGGTKLKLLLSDSL
jgi:hypothetical protein